MYFVGVLLSEWASRLGINPMMPMPEDLLVRALEEVASIASNFTVHDWESDAAMKNQSMVLFGKVARALLNNNRSEVLDKLTQAFTKVRAVFP